MDGMNNSWGMGYGYGWIFGLIVLVGFIWLVVKAANKKNKGV